jgi:drug/metabolite transporter (DMT)-like permease
MSDRPAARPYLWMIFSALSFSSMGALSKVLSVSSDWRLLAVVRAALMLLFAGALGVATRAPFTLKATPMLWMRSLVGSLSMICTFYTLTHLPFSEATTLIKSYPLWVAVLSWIVLGDRPSAKVWFAILTGVVGVVMIAQPHFDEARLALAVGILSSICTAVVMLGLNKLAHVDARSIVMHFGVVSTVICGLVYFVFAGVRSMPRAFAETRGVAMLTAVGLLGTLGQIALTKAFATGDPSRVSVVGLSELIFGVAYDRLLWERRFGWMTLAGMLLVAAPTAWLLATSRRGRGGSSGSPGSDAVATTP